MNSWEQMLFGPLLFIHGVGHLVVLGAALTLASVESTLGNLARVARYQSPLGQAWPLLWLAAAGTLLAAAVGLVAGQTWWGILALVGVASSLAAIVPWWALLDPRPGRYESPLFLPVQLWKATTPGTRLAMLLDCFLLLALAAR